MEQTQFEELLSNVKHWIDQMLTNYSERMQPVADAGFEKLKDYYSEDILNRVQRVVVDRWPVPPLKAFGLRQLAEIEYWDLKGIPWKNTILIRCDLSGWDAVQVHEIRPEPPFLPRGPAQIGHGSFRQYRHTLFSP